MTDKTIVIVDDEEELRENLRDLLEFKDYNVVIYPNAEEFLHQFDPSSVDLVLMDYQLPIMNGLDAIKRLKELKPNLPAALVTASSQPVIIEEAKENGVDEIIFKPYTHEDILKTVEKLLLV